MKKLLFTFIAAAALLTVNTTDSQAQTYKTGLGLGIDFGTGTTLVGPSIKHFFNPNSAIEGDVLFGGSSTVIQAFYQYHGQISGAQGLQWYVGGGPGVQLYDGGSTFLLRPMVGLDFKIPGAPIAFAFDWRPAMQFFDGDTDFEPARFGLGIKYTF